MISGRTVSKTLTAGLALLLGALLAMNLAMAQDGGGEEAADGGSGGEPGRVDRGAERGGDRPGFGRDPLGRERGEMRGGPERGQMRGGPGRGGMPRGPGGDRSPGPRRWRDAPLATPEQMEWALPALKEFDPLQAERFQRVLSARPEQARRLFSILVPELKKLEYEKVHQPELYAARKEMRRLEHEIRGAHRRYGEAIRNKNTADERKFAEVLRKLIGARFDQEQIIRRKELEKVQQAVKDLEKEIREKEENRDQLIETAFERLGHPPAPQTTPASATDRKSSE